MPDTSSIHSVLFCCSHNALRSPMAEGLLKYYGKNRFFCDSCGLHIKPPDPFMISSMEENDVSMHLHNPKTFENLVDLSFDIIIALSEDAHIKALKFTQNIACQVEYWQTDDPSLIEGDRTSVLHAYRNLRQELTSKIITRFNLTPLPPS